jgi:hypothetical protein
MTWTLGKKASSLISHLIQCDRERERVRKDSIRVEEKRKHFLGESEWRFVSEGEKRASC